MHMISIFQNCLIRGLDSLFLRNFWKVKKEATEYIREKKNLNNRAKVWSMIRKIDNKYRQNTANHDIIDFSVYSL